MNCEKKYIKFCGIKRDEDIDYVNRLIPDYIGFIFYEPSHRNISKQKAKQLKSLISKKIKSVGVFVNKDVKEVSEICNETGLDMIQLHGNEDTAYIEKLKRLTALPVIKAVRFKSKEQVYNANNLPVDFLLIDTYNKDMVGGTGRAFDWSELPEITKPYFLAGGIDAANISKAMLTDAYCIDVSSGIETDKNKDFEKMKQIINIIRGN